MSQFSRVEVSTARLVPQIPFVLSWLRHKQPRAADLFLGMAKEVDDQEVQYTWKRLLEEYDTYGDLSTAQLRSVCAAFEPAVLARAVHTLFMGAEPRIVPKKISMGLFAAMKKVKNMNDGPEVAKLLSGELDKMKLVCLEALGELCALIRDTSGDPRYTASGIGPSVFLDESYEQADIIIASRTMQAMVDHAEFVFGKPGSVSKFDPLGVRRPDYNEDSRSRVGGGDDGENSSVSGMSRVEQVQKKEINNALSEAGFM